MENSTRDKPLGEFEGGDFNSIVEFTAAGHREVAPVYMKDEDTGLLAVYGSHGLYRMGILPGGRPIVLYAADPDDLNPAVHRDPEFREKYAPGYYLDPKEIDDIEVVEARRSRTHKKWVAQAITTHSYYQSEVKTEYGFLRRVAEDMWFSRAIAYTLDPAYYSDGTMVTAKDGTRLFHLRCYTTAGKGTPFTDDHEKAIRERRALAIASKKMLIRPAYAERIIHEDFLKRAELVMRDMDPNRLGQIKGEPGLSSTLAPQTGFGGKLRHMGVHYFVRLAQGLQQMYRDLKAQVVVMGLSKTLLLSVIKIVSQGWRAGIGQVRDGPDPAFAGCRQKGESPDGKQ